MRGRSLILIAGRGCTCTSRQAAGEGLWLCCLSPTPRCPKVHLQSPPATELVLGLSAAVCSLSATCYNCPKPGPTVAGSREAANSCTSLWSPSQALWRLHVHFWAEKGLGECNPGLSPTAHPEACMQLLLSPWNLAKNPEAQCSSLQPPGCLPVSLGFGQLQQAHCKQLH